MPALSLRINRFEPGDARSYLYGHVVKSLTDFPPRNPVPVTAKVPPMFLTSIVSGASSKQP
jgi:hypothetical protein